MSTFTTRASFLKIDVRDDETPVFAPTTPTHYVRKVGDLGIKQIPYTVRRTELTFDIDQLKAGSIIKTSEILDLNYILLHEYVDVQRDNVNSERLFRIMDMEQLSYGDKAAVRFHIVLDPLATASWNAIIFYNTMKATARWSAVPDAPDNIERIQMRPDVMVNKKSLLDLPVDDPNPESRTLFQNRIAFVQVAGISKYTVPIPDSQLSEIRQDFMIAGYYVMIGPTYNKRVHIKTMADVLLADDLPTLDEIINNPDVNTPFLAGDILDIAISYKGPFDVASVTENANGIIVKMNEVINTAASSGTAAQQAVRLYIKVPIGQRYTESMTLSLTNNEEVFEKACGTLQVRDGYGQVVGNIDTRHFGSATSMTLIYECFSQYTGLTSALYLPDGSKITIPEGHLPYNGSAYAEYVAHEREYDREMLQIAKDKNTANLINNSAGALSTGIMTSTLSGGAGGATALIGVGTSIINYEFDRVAAERELAAKEKQVMGTSDTAYGASYGSEYYEIDAPNKAIRRTIQLVMPKTATVSEFESFVKDTGYPVTNLYKEIDLFTCGESFIKATKSPTFTLTLTPGYTPLYTVELNTSLLGRWVSDQLKNGVRIKRC